jgi:ribosome biogenesis GTPase
MQDLRIPRRLARAVASRHGEPGELWLAALPARIGVIAERWDLSVGAAFDPGGTTAWTGMARQARGDVVVLKVRMTAEDATREAAALRIWDGDGAIRVLRDEGEALLLELCEPGDRLSSVSDFEAQDKIACGLLRRLHRSRATGPAADGLPRLRDFLASRADTTRRRNTDFGEPVPRRTLEDAVDILDSEAGGTTLLHGDYQLENTLAARREPWLAVDPEAMVGAPEYDLVQYLLYRGGSVADRQRDWAAHFTRLAAELRVEAELVQRLAFAKLVHDALWALELGDPGWRSHVEVAELLRKLVVVRRPRATAEGAGRLHPYGWGEALGANFGRHPTLSPARVLSVHEGLSLVATAEAEELVWNNVPPARHKVVVGDWVGVAQERFERSQPKQPAARRSRAGSVLDSRERGRRGIVLVLPRPTVLHRRLAGSPDDLIASHVDVVLVVASLAPRLRLESLVRYVALAVRGGLTPSIVLTKVDLRRPSGGELASIRRALALDDVQAISAVTGEGLEHFTPAPRTTSVLIGPSGAGKSTLLNALFGADLQVTRAVSRGGAGQHTTTASRLHVSTNGAMYIDTPGVHQLGRIDHDLVAAVFADVVQIGNDCRYPSCVHRTEPDCAVQGAIADGRLSAARLDLYRTLHRDQASAARHRGQKS